MSGQRLLAGLGAALAVAACPWPVAAQIRVPWGLNLKLTESFGYSHNRAADLGKVDNYCSDLDLLFIQDDTTVGVQIRNANLYPANPEIPTERFNEVRKAYLEWRRPGLQVSAGDFYASFGKGLSLSVTKGEALQQDRTISGGMTSFTVKGVKSTLLGGLAVAELTGDRDSVFAGEVLLPRTQGIEVGLRLAHARDWNEVILAGQRTTGTVGVTASNLWGVMDFTTELGYLWHEGGKNGRAAYLGSSVHRGAWSMLVEYKDYFRFDNGFNNPPLADLEDEKELLADIYGLFVKNNYHWAKPKVDLYGSVGYSTHFQATKDTVQYFGGLLKNDLLGRVNVQAEYGQRRGLDVKHRALVSTDFSLTPDYSAQFSLSGDTVRGGLGSLAQWHTVVGFSRASRFNLSWVHEFGNRIAQGRTRFDSVQLAVDVNQAIRTTVYLGSSRGGLLCAGGICRYEPPFRGAKLNLQYRF